jgi:hypothetical protein
MASPYVAGRRCSFGKRWLSPDTNITQDQIYQVMASTADLVRPVTASYRKLNMQRADSTMPTDDYGSTVHVRGSWA